jgi:hypothetical protein
VKEWPIKEKFGTQVMIRFILGLGTIIAGVGFIEGSSSFAIGIPVIVVGAIVMLWALTKSQITQ